MQQEEQKKNIYMRLHTAIGKMPKPAMSAKGNWGNYPKLEDVLAVVKPALFAEGLFFMQTIVQEDAKLWVSTVTYSVEGERIEARYPFVISGDVKGRTLEQSTGGASTYNKRQGLLAAYGLVGDPDVDAEPDREKTPESEADKEFDRKAQKVKLQEYKQGLYDAKTLVEFESVKERIKEEGIIGYNAGYDLLQEFSKKHAILAKQSATEGKQHDKKQST